MRGKGKRAAAVLLLALLLAGLSAPVQAYRLASNTGFADVVRGDWYEQALLKMQNMTKGIISGVWDEDGVLRFHPNDPVKRGEFLKMLMIAAEALPRYYPIDRSRDSVHWAGRYYTLALEYNVLLSDPFGENQDAAQKTMFPCTFQALEKYITRYEMAALISNVCNNPTLLREDAVNASNAYANIKDYKALDREYVSAVEQAFGKGILTGYEDGSFRGQRNLKRCEAAVVIYRMLWAGERDLPLWALYPDYIPPERQADGAPAGYRSFAAWLQDGHIIYDAEYGTIPDEEARVLLFGDANTYYFSSAEEAAPYVTTLKIPIWAIDKTGTKYSTHSWIGVNKMVAEEVQLIFQQIYDDPERFPIYGGNHVGGCRYGDTMRHAWGCAIDINPLFNCECNFHSGSMLATSGYGWRPEGVTEWAGRPIDAYAGSMAAEDSPYSITPEGSVVRAFADYSWGWLGAGFYGANNFDFMHFSVLEGGG